MHRKEIEGQGDKYENKFNKVRRVVLETEISVVNITLLLFLKKKKYHFLQNFMGEIFFFFFFIFPDSNFIWGYWD